MSNERVKEVVGEKGGSELMGLKLRSRGDQYPSELLFSSSSRVLAALTELRDVICLGLRVFKL